MYLNKISRTPFYIFDVFPIIITDLSEALNFRYTSVCIYIITLNIILHRFCLVAITRCVPNRFQMNDTDNV